MTMVFVRHAESIGNTITSDARASHYLPNHLFPLTQNGEWQATIVGKFLKKRFSPSFFDLAICSDFLRTQETRRIILFNMGCGDIEMTIDSRINEKWDGIFHDLTKDELESKYPEQIYLRKKHGYYMYRPPGGENCPDVEMRLRSFISDYRNTCLEKNILVVGHGRSFLLLQKILHNLTVEEFIERKENGICKNCSLAIYDSLFPKNDKAIITPWEKFCRDHQSTNFA